MVLEDATRSELEQEILNLWEQVGDLEEKLAVAVEALEFYALKKNWGYNENPKNQRHLAWGIVKSDCGYCPENEKFVGGKRARQCLKELEDK